MSIRKELNDAASELTTWRRELHKMPEMAFDEVKTSTYVADKLKSFGIDEVHEGIAGTGIVGVIRGKTNDSGKAVMLRSDIDALRIHEHSDLEHASQHAGVMHACGHDGHMTMLLGAARHLTQTRDFDGTVYVVFQPAEEIGQGAKALIKDGLFTKFPCDEVYGLHNFPALPFGTMASAAGPVLAALDTFRVTITGGGGHTSRPHEAGDIVLPTAKIMVEIQEFSRAYSLGKKDAVMQIGPIATNTQNMNVVPESITFQGTIRSYDEEGRSTLKNKITEIVGRISETAKVGSNVDFSVLSPVVSNDIEKTESAMKAARAVAGDANVITLPRAMGGEDFAYFLKERPGNFMVIGTGIPDKKPELHSARYDFNDAALPLGSSYWVELAESALPVKAKAPKPI